MFCEKVRWEESTYYCFLQLRWMQAKKLLPEVMAGEWPKYPGVMGVANGGSLGWLVQSQQLGYSFGVSTKCLRPEASSRGGRVGSVPNAVMASRKMFLKAVGVCGQLVLSCSELCEILRVDSPWWWMGRGKVGRRSAEGGGMAI